MRRYGAAGYGRYFMMLEMIVACGSYVLTLFEEDWEIIVEEMRFADIDEAREFVAQCVQWDLFQSSDELQTLECRGLIRRMQARERIREKLRLAGLESARKRKERREQEEQWRDTAPKWFDRFVGSFRVHYPLHDRAFIAEPKVDKELYDACMTEDGSLSQDKAKEITRGVKRYNAHFTGLTQEERKYHATSALNWIVRKGWENAYDV